MSLQAGLNINSGDELNDKEDLDLNNEMLNDFVQNKTGTFAKITNTENISEDN